MRPQNPYGRQRSRLRASVRRVACTGLGIVDSAFGILAGLGLSLLATISTLLMFLVVVAVWLVASGVSGASAPGWVVLAAMLTAPFLLGSASTAAALRPPGSAGPLTGTIIGAAVGLMWPLVVPLVVLAWLDRATHSTSGPVAGAPRFWLGDVASLVGGTASLLVWMIWLVLGAMAAGARHYLRNTPA